ncbi:MAG: NAD-dependent epimerase/dehydratase family protein, partial [Rhodothermia bacterium]
MTRYPEIIESVEQLDEVMTRPSAALVEFLGGLSGRLVVLGAGGKMGPSLCTRAARAVRDASGNLAVVGVSRFSDEAARAQLESAGVETIACDLMDPSSVAALPDADYVIFLVGWKFGTSESPGRTWTVNTLTPSLAAERYRDARIVALSSGNVYPFVSPASGGADESCAPSPIGEYAWSCLGRERVFQHWSDVHNTRVALIRLNYAVDLRYGVLVDLASTIKAGGPVDLTTGFLNCVWQGDANDLIIRSLSL